MGVPIMAKELVLRGTGKPEFEPWVPQVSEVQKVFYGPPVRVATCFTPEYLAAMDRILAESFPGTDWEMTLEERFHGRRLSV